MDVLASMRQGTDGRWVAALEGHPEVSASGPSVDGCVANLRRAVDRAGLLSRGTGGSSALIVQVVPVLAGVAEASQVMGWDKRRVVTYIDRGRFPEPIQTLASGRVWVRSDIEAYAREWRARRSGRGRPTP